MTTDPQNDRYRMKPIEVEARQLLGSEDGEPAREIARWCGGWLGSTFKEPKLVFPTRDGDRVARVGDWIVRGGKGEFYPVHADDFAETYAPAVSSPLPDQTALRNRIAEALHEHLSRTADIRPGRDGEVAFMPEVTDEERLRIANALAAVLPPPANRAVVLRVEAALVRAHCPDHLDSQSAEGSWINCHCDVADDMERRAAEAQAAEHPSLYAQSGVDTPSCDCGHDGMGMRWHREPCAWLAGLAAEAREVLAKDDGAEAQQPDTETPEWCKCQSCWGWFVEDHPGEDLDELGKDLSWWSGLPAHRDAPAGFAADGSGEEAAVSTKRPTLRERHRAAWNALTPAEQNARIAALDATDEEADRG